MGVLDLAARRKYRFCAELRTRHVNSGHSVRIGADTIDQTQAGRS